MYTMSDMVIFNMQHRGPFHSPVGFQTGRIVYVYLTYTGQFKKKVTLSHVCNEVTSEPTVTRYTTVVRKTLKVCL
jgi:hypothetical protein